MNKPLCFVLMPFGKKPDAKGRTIDFNAVYNDLIKPAIIAADLEPIRADEEVAGGIIATPMFERLILCDYAVADLTTANPNVFYELGVRHAVRGNTTIPIYAFDRALPFDLNQLRTLPYNLDENGALQTPEEDSQKLANWLKEIKAMNDKPEDSPVFNLIDGWQVKHNLTHQKTEVFREKARHNESLKMQIGQAEKKGLEALKALEAKMLPINAQEAGVLVELMLAYRAVKGYEEMINLVNNMDIHVANITMVQEQKGFALNRLGKRDEAQKILEDVIKKVGINPETNGLLGRVYKDQYKEYEAAEDERKARRFLKKAADTYLDGFQADWRDAFPGINAVTLMAIQNPPDERLKETLPIVKYSVNQTIRQKNKTPDMEPDYWDYATLMELAVLENDKDAAYDNLDEALGRVSDHEKWMPETTANNMKIIKNALEDQGEDTKLVSEIIDELLA